MFEFYVLYVWNNIRVEECFLDVLVEVIGDVSVVVIVEKWEGWIKMFKDIEGG